MLKHVYLFSEGNASMRNLLGGKGANLAEMTNIGLPIPNGFIITTEACISYFNDSLFLEKLKAEVVNTITKLEQATGKKLGDVNNPLLLSIRSGARVSMPGMMDTVLNLGFNDKLVKELIKTHDARFIYDSYRRFIQMFGDVVMGIPHQYFEEVITDVKTKQSITNDIDLTAQDMHDIVGKFKAVYEKETNLLLPEDPLEQIMFAIEAVFKSWHNERAKVYRRLNNIPDEWGTAVVVQEMVYGNLNNNSATGVAFTRNPATGTHELYGEFLINAQGEDVVAGIRTPEPIKKLKDIMPECYMEFVDITKHLEAHYRDMQDIEFTIENNKLYILQTRTGKRTAKAALKIALDMVEEQMITKEEAILRIDPEQMAQLMHPTFDDEALRQIKPIAKGLPASPGAVSGKLCFSAKEVVTALKNGACNIILVRNETSAEDIEGMNLAQGILTIRGGMTSHAAVVARGMGKCCITGCGALTINEEKQQLITADGSIYHAEDYISLDGSSGLVYTGKINTIPPVITPEFNKLINWAQEIKTLQIRANADNAQDAQTALKLGATGIGLCRTEHMFLQEKRLLKIRQMILATTEEERNEALQTLLPMQRADFVALFKTMQGYPITIRLLDPPLHEFLPSEEADITLLAQQLNLSAKKLIERIKSLKETNPMMGHRGARVYITYPEVAKMQTQAIIEAALQVRKEGLAVKVEIMIPLISDLAELKYIKAIIQDIADTVMASEQLKLDYTIGTMIEVPRATLIASHLAREVAFFSFGTNDLTQMTYGFSRDDAKFLEDYYQKQLFTFDPFSKLDQDGVGQLMQLAIVSGRRSNPKLKIGICGEHGGDSSSIEFCHNLGLDYVSCSPFRVPVAILAAAQAKIKSSSTKK
ncbi:MAG: pyruvate, phosphate dikinase [Bacilli bacterium]|jgi:pyruvate,orthophosphate dikinase